LNVEALAAELARQRRPFALVTVLWRRAPSSGKQGDKAIILADGKLRGWIGGACAEPAVIREALRVLESQTPRLVFLGPPADLPARRRDGLVLAPIACQSEGALEVYIEPVLPAPHLIVVGGSPAVDGLCALAKALDWQTTVVDDGGLADDHASADLVMTSLDLSAAGASADSFIVIATQGHYDEDALEQALATDAPYIGLVASRRRAASLLGYLRDRGVSDEALGRLHTPAGLDLGRIAHDEIGVAIVAEIVKLKAAGELRQPLRRHATPPEEEVAVDPVCGMAVEVASARYRAEHEQVVHYFCCPACLRLFESDPVSYLTSTA